MKRSADWKALLRFLGIMLVAEGGLMALCLVPAIHYNDGTAAAIALSTTATLATGILLWSGFRYYRRIENSRMSYLLVTLMWLSLTLFATLPLLTTGATSSFTRAWFEAMSGLTSTGATVFPRVSTLPSSVLLWRSMTQWLGGFGIVLLVLALIPHLGINRHSLYTAEASGVDNGGHKVVGTATTVRRTLTVYLALTILFVVLLVVNDMRLWDAINLTFTNISSGGFSIHDDSIATLTAMQQCILAAAMLLSGINFTLLFFFFTFRWRQIGHKLDQFRFYILIMLAGATFVVIGLHFKGSLGWNDATRMGLVQTISALTTTGSVVADTSQWWTPLCFLLLMLSICGGMAGSTSGGLKAMRVLILLRNARAILRNHLHPNAVSPLRLNGNPVSSHIRSNVMVIFIVYGVTLLAGTMGLMVCGVSATEAVGATAGCLTGYGPGLAASGGFGSYAMFPPAAMWVCSLLMLLGRLECMTVLVLCVPRFWRR